LIPTVRIDIIKYAKDNSSEICSLSFGVKKPVTLTALKEGKIISIKSFGDGRLYQKCNLERELRSKINFKIGERNKHEHPHTAQDKKLHLKKRNALKKISRKIGFRNQRFVNYYNQKLSYEIIDYIKNIFKHPIIIFRDTKRIKDISYKGDLRKVLDRWSLEQQKSFIEYKSYLNEIPLIKIAYKDTNIVKCSKCGKEHNLKVTTEKLKFTSRFICEECKYEQDLYVNDSINLWKQFEAEANAV
jgi:hypothetical protein